MEKHLCSLQQIKKFLGIIAVADTIKEDSPKAIKELKDMGLYVVMITGDNERKCQCDRKDSRC